MAILKLGEVTAPAVNARFLPWLRTNQIHQVFKLLQCVQLVDTRTTLMMYLRCLMMVIQVKAAVVEMLGLHTEKKSARSLIKEGLTHEDEGVRAAAMTAYRAHAGDRAERHCANHDGRCGREAAVRVFESKDLFLQSDVCVNERWDGRNRDVRAAILDS